MISISHKAFEPFLSIINKLLSLHKQQELTIDIMTKTSSLMRLLSIKIINHRDSYQYPQSINEDSPQELFSELIKAISSTGYLMTNSLNSDSLCNESSSTCNLPDIVVMYLLLALDLNKQSITELLLTHFDLNEQMKVIRILKNYIDVSSAPALRIEALNGIQKLHTKITMLENKAKLKEQSLTAKIGKLKKEMEEMKQKENLILNINPYNSSSSIASSSEKEKKMIKQAIMNSGTYSPIRLSIPNENGKLTIETFSIDELKTPSKFSKVKLTDQDYLKIILKKDYIINQLRSMLEDRELTSKVKEDVDKCEETVSLYKKELEEFKARYELEFELMSSAMYSLGLNYLSYREKNLLQYHTNWLIKQKQQYFYHSEDKTEY